MDQLNPNELGATTSNRARARKREAAKLPLPVNRKSEIEALDQLIVRVMKACGKGSTRRGKSNPAFGQLSMLIRTRAFLLRDFDPAKKSFDETLRELDLAIGKATN